MAVPQNKKSRSRTKMRRSRARLTCPELCLEKEGSGKASGELRRRHHIGADGIYRGARYFQPKSTIAADEDES